jgi:hypothetical protein
MLVTLHNKSVHTEWIQPRPAMIYTESPSGDLQAVRLDFTKGNTMQKLPPIYKNALSAAIVVLLIVKSTTSSWSGEFYRNVESVARRLNLWSFESAADWFGPDVAYWFLENATSFWFITVAALLVLLLVIRYILWKKKRLRLLAELNESEEYDILKLWKYRLVLPRATGQSITHINAEVQNLTNKRLQVIIFPGTYFVSSGNHQNMVICDKHYFRLNKLATGRFSVPAACINAKLPIPGKNDYFKGVAKVSKNLIRFLKRARSEDSRVIQAGVWAITDCYSKWALLHNDSAFRLKALSYNVLSIRAFN